MIKAKKKFGQNFLKDESVKQKIIQAMPNDDKPVVEIGPGLGDLTRELLDAQKRVTAFEIDLELCGYLQKRFKTELKSGQLELVCNDVLEEWQHDSLRDEAYHLIANLPYYVATNIILKALADQKCRSILVMIQKEVALKFAAKSGEKAFSALSILANSISKAQILFDVGRECFDPPPKVVSAVLQLEKFRDYTQSDLFGTKEELEAFQAFLKAAFQQPRKVLIKNLQSLYPKEALLEQFETLEISSVARPHQLKTSDYHLLFKNLNK
ncbi:MAG: 16S rRNA (adenine(1518)-N(6)/adenine(1519)-N(6))-dimethyltransferase [Sulfurospirillum sp.]|nr:MAG: 16S rRNA (adenine(1518)-N(6)/adenine(1519)-N(6))-dimethyltransferase [Sulfurospirillum sp.]